MDDDDRKDADAPRVNPGYVRGQLVRSLRAAAQHSDPRLRDQALARARGFADVLARLAENTLRVGSRQPDASVPVWVTPEVLRGGFPSGACAAGGALRDHEVALADALGLGRPTSRSTLNGHFLGAAGLDELSARLADRTYRIDVPEEAALLAVRWLIEKQKLEMAADLLETIEPWFDRLRFFPRPATRPMPDPRPEIDAPIPAASIEEVVAVLERKRPSEVYEAMRERLDVWNPMTDEAVDLVLETVEGEWPRFEDAAGRRVTVGGLPFTRLPDSFEVRRLAWLRRYAEAKAHHPRCRGVHRPKETLGMLAHALEALPRLDERERLRWARRLRHRLAGFLAAHGVPRTRTRAPRRLAPSHARLAHLLARRLASIGDGEVGLEPPDVAFVLRPVEPGEASAVLPAGTPIPSHLAEPLRRVRPAPLREFVRSGIVRSAEQMAAVLPRWVGPTLASRFSHPAPRSLYAATYAAFRKRRSLLLLRLQHQVTFAELPWVAAIEATSDRDCAPHARALARDAAALALVAFPATILPNKLVAELVSLTVPARASGGSSDKQNDAFPLVEELAADIFTGSFSWKFLRAAKLAARWSNARVGGSLYARYYGIDYARILEMSTRTDRWGVATCPEFDAYCAELAALPETQGRWSSVRRNGCVIEQASIVTTHNLALLVDCLNVEEALGEPWTSLARRTFDIVVDQIERDVLCVARARRSPDDANRRRAAKNAAFAWRNLVFYLSCADPADQRAFLDDANSALSRRSNITRKVLAPFFRGLAHAVVGGTLPRSASLREIDGMRRLLGWTVDAHPLLAALDTACVT